MKRFTILAAMFVALLASSNVMADTPLRDLAVDLHGCLSKNVKSNSTIAVAEVKLKSGKTEIVITINPGIGGTKGCTVAEYATKCKEALDAVEQGDMSDEEFEQAKKDAKKKLNDELTEGSKGGWKEKAKVLAKIAELKAGGDTRCFKVIEDLKKHKFDFSGGGWPHAEDVVDCHLKENAGSEICGIGIAWAGCDKPIMCPKCYCKFGPDGKDWPCPEGSDEVKKPKPKKEQDTNAQVQVVALEKTWKEIMIEKATEYKEGLKQKADIEDVKRDGGNDIEQCDKFSEYSISFDIPVIVEPGALSLVHESTGQVVDVGLPTVFEETTVYWSFDDLPYGEYQLTINQNKILSRDYLCVLDIEEDGASTVVWKEVVAMPGDTDQSMSVGLGDFFTVLQNAVFPIEVEGLWAEGDFNDDDGVTVFPDLVMTIVNFGRSY